MIKRQKSKLPKKDKKPFKEKIMLLSKNGYFISFMLSLLLGILIIGPSIIAGDGILTLIADFNFQQIPFNEYINTAIKNGEILWTWVNDLGSNFIGTFSFYNLTSPFVLLGLLFPAQWFPYLIGPIFILKYALAGLFAYLYLQQYVKNKKWAILGSVLYAFSGFQLTNMLFYHFHDVVVFFPLLLYSLDKLVLKNKKTLFCISVALALFTNYYFFIGEVVFLIIYYLVRVLTKSYPFSFRSLGKIIFNGCLGVGIGAIILLPSIFFVLDNPRVENAWTIKSMFSYDINTYLEIVRALILPSDTMSTHSILSSTNYKSIELFLPFVGAILTLSYVFKNKKNWYSVLFIVCLFFLLVAILNSSFLAFTNTYYARWFYMPILIMCLLSIKCLDENVSIKPGVIITLILFGLLGLGLCYIYFILDIKILYNKEAFLVYLITFATCLIILCLIMKFAKNKFLWLMLGIIIYVILRGNYFFYQSKGTFTNDNNYVNKFLTANETLNFKNQDARYDFASGCYFNLSYLGNFPSVRVFNGNINGSNFEFWQSVGIPDGSLRSISTYLLDEEKELRNFLSIKYVISCDQRNKVFDENYEFLGKRKSYYIYENKNSKNMGISYNYYLNTKDFEKLDYAQRRKVLNKAIILNDTQIKKYQSLLKEYQPNKDNYLNKLSVNQFTFENGGFTSRIKTNKDTLILYTIPYEHGWTANVNNEKANIEKVDSGLMAIKVNKGTNYIEFKYTPPGLKAGLVLSILSLFILIARVIYYKISPQKLSK